MARNLEIIGEAANCLPDEFKKKHSEIEWHKVVGLRHRIIHEYFGVDLAQGFVFAAARTVAYPRLIKNHMGH